MSETAPGKHFFIDQLNAEIAKNLADERFGVSELAEAMNMSRSNLLRKVKKETGLPVNQLISQARLKKAMELLQTTTLNVSEVSNQVGFNSSSYFIKCFREYYGFPPGEAAKREIPQGDQVAVQKGPPTRRRMNPVIALTVALLALGLVAIAVILWPHREDRGEKSIAVLPFKNESSDSSNVYLINGLMEATLNNLQQIRELKVTSRTTSEKYRNTSKSVPEIANELNVRFFVEGSGQKIGDRILLNIQLIDAATDKHLWAKQYRRETKEIFELQQEIARNIADEIEVIITPEAQQQIGKKPTDDLVAYDYFLKGKDLFYRSRRGDLENSIPWFQRAIERDPEFSLAHATLAMVYYYLDLFQTEKKYADEISRHADKAMLFDPRSGESLVVKALDYTNKKQYQQALPFFEKALEYSPHSGLVLHFLNEFYSLYVPNPVKHLEYALRKVRLDLNSDSSTIAFDYFHLSNAFFQNGFLEAAEAYINKSLAYDSNGYFTGYVRAYVVNMKTNDMANIKRMLLAELAKDSTRFDIVQEVGKICFMMRDHAEAFKYYRKFYQTREALHLDLYHSEDLRIAIVFAEMGLQKEANKLIVQYKEFAENDLTIYKPLLLAMYYAHMKDQAKALEQLRIFSKEETFIYPVICLADDPLMDPVSKSAEFKSIMEVIRNKFWATHRKIRDELNEEDYHL
jgi:TolB-like protein/AraC-like DNA-binding protein